MRGISVYQRAGRPTWYVAYKDPVTKKRVCEATGHALGEPQGKRRAYEYAAAKGMSGIGAGRKNPAEAWETWAVPWLTGRYRNQQRTLESYLVAWKFLRLFLAERKIDAPRHLTYQHAVEFVRWRESQVKRSSGKKVSRNTALHNVKVLSRLMREAVRRGFATGNPCLTMSDDVPADPVPEKPELTNDDIAKIRGELNRREGVGRPAPWMAVSFEIALHQGCRLSATAIPMERIDFENRTIRFHEKGSRGKKAIFTEPIHPDLYPLLVKLRDDGKNETCTLPRFASRNFGRVLKAIGLPHTMHSARVTVISRMARGGVPLQHAMSYVHHANWAIHRVYTRLKPADVEGCHDALSFGPSPHASPGTPERDPAQKTDAPQATVIPFPALNSAR